MLCKDPLASMARVPFTHSIRLPKYRTQEMANLPFRNKTRSIDKFTQSPTHCKLTVIYETQTPPWMWLCLSRMRLGSDALRAIEGHPTPKSTLKTSVRPATRKIKSSSEVVRAMAASTRESGYNRKRSMAWSIISRTATAGSRVRTAIRAACTADSVSCLQLLNFTLYLLLS